MKPLQSIPEYFAAKNVFITGGTGLLGKVITEKLLRSCPDVGDIYLLVRTRKGVDPGDRLKEYCNHVIFDLLRTVQPDALNKIKLIRGNVAELGLGLSSEDRQLLQEHVHIIFNAAASVRFDDPLCKAILTNVRSTREVVDLALGMKNLQVLTHISTAYSNSQIFDIEEKIYPAPGDWQKFIKAAETLDPFLLDIITKRMLGKIPNTYVFTKSLAEHVINDHRHLLPVVIHRPSVVFCVGKEPIPGYTDNFNGPTGLILAVGKGIMKVALVDGNSLLDCIPSDDVAKSVIIVTWKRGFLPSSDGIEVYNACTNGSLRSTFNNIKDHGLAVISVTPVSCVSYPTIHYTQSKMIYMLLFYSMQLSLAIFMDLFLRLQGKKPMFVKVQRKLLLATHVLSYFSNNAWSFHNKRFLKLQKDILDCDIRNFQYCFEDTDLFLYYSPAIKATRQYLLHENVTEETAKMIYDCLYLLYCFLSSTAVWVALWASYTYSLPHKLLSVLIHVLQTVLIL
ncbi:fatty acyl-CoA reductase 1 [Anabrus simplex]|uniref:fatty acyl-CoA reductase 1 n=1 Tax=Anabrus simplex TaxID=316456 RepID=UPI0035A2C6ED